MNSDIRLHVQTLESRELLSTAAAAFALRGITAGSVRRMPTTPTNPVENDPEPAPVQSAYRIFGGGTIITSSRRQIPAPTGGGETGNLPQRMSHIRLAMLAYSSLSYGAYEQNLLQNRVDLVIPNPRFLQQFENDAPTTGKILYSNASNIYLELLTDWLKYADDQQMDRESAFYHVNQPVAFQGNSPSSIPVSRFWAMNLTRSNGTVQDVTQRSNSANPVALPTVGETLAIGYPEKFAEITLEIAGGGAWTGRWEYAAGFNSSGQPIWKTLQPTSVGGGVFRFDPPADWKAGSVNGSQHLFVIRMVGQTSTPVVANRISGRDYVNAGQGTTGTIPAYDYQADSNGDGYLTDAEYANRRSGFEARFEYESRLFYPYYGQQRYATRPDSAEFTQWAVDYHQRMLAAHPDADGIFLDNSIGRLQITPTTVVENYNGYAANYGLLVGAIQRGLGTKLVVTNISGARQDAIPQLQQGVSGLDEFAIRPMQHHHSFFEDLATNTRDRLAALQQGQYLILDTHPNGGDITDPRMQLATLSYYYLLADPTDTMLMVNGGNEPSSAWTRHYIPAAEYNVGQPKSDWITYATGGDPSNTALEYRVYARSYDNALILYKPLSYTRLVGTGTTADNTATTHQLKRNYQILNADGTRGAIVNKITLRNGEGAILIPV
ncbi:MAG: hypothetical protein R3B84_18865 [Zavarzinella sp.]